MEKLLPVKPFRQRPGYCGPACLKMVLGYFGEHTTEGRLVRLSGCTRSSGVGARGLLKAAAKLGFKGKVRDNCELADIRRYIKRRVPPIVDWFDADGGHYCVVIGIDRENIYFMDPSLGHRRAMKLRTFKRLWFDFPGSFIKSRSDLIIRRMIVVHP